MAEKDVIGYSYDDDPSPDSGTPESGSELSGQENVQDNQDTTQNTLSPAEETARASGWVSKKEWVEQGKNPAEWRDAEMFNLAGELMGRIQTQSSQLTQANKKVQDLEIAVKQMAEMTQKQIEQERANLLKELRKERAEAITEGNADKIGELDTLIDEVRDSAQNAPPQSESTQDNPPQIPQEILEVYQSFASSNPWYQQDAYLQSVFNYTADTIHQQNPQKPVAAILEEAKKEVVKNNSNHPAFKSTRSPPRDYNGSGDGDRSASSGNGAGTGFTWSDLDSEQQTAAAQFINAGLYKNRAEAVKAYADLGLIGEE